jgi:hypothetical protein
MRNASALQWARSSYRGTSPDAGVSIPFARVAAAVVPPVPRVSERSASSTGAPSWALRGIVSGIVAGAAMLGLLIGIGRRAGTAWRPINAAAHGVLGSQADGVWSYHGSVTPMGGLVVLVMSVVAGLVTARIAPTFRTLHVATAATGVAFVGYLLHLHVVARTPGGLADLLTVGELRALYLTLGVALVAGMRFAFSTGAATLER